MIIVVGSSSSLVPCVIDQLRCAWLRADGPLVDESCRDAVVRTAATAIVIACPPPALGARRIEPWDESLVRDALAATDIMTFYGPVKFDETGKNTAKPMVLYQIQDGQYKVVAPTEWAAAKLVHPMPTWEEREGS